MNNKGGNINIKEDFIKFIFIKNNLLEDNNLIINYKLSFNYFNNDYEKIYNILFDFLKPDIKIKKLKYFINIFPKEFLFLSKHRYNYYYNYKMIDKNKLNNLEDFYIFMINLINNIIFNNKFIELFNKNDINNFINTNNLINKKIINNDIKENLKNFLYYSKYYLKKCINNKIKENNKLKNLILSFFDLILNSNIFKSYDLIIDNNNSFNNFIQMQELNDFNDIDKLFLNPKYQSDIFYYLIHFTYQLIIYSINDDGFIENFDINNLPALSMFNEDHLLYEYYENFILFIINKYKR